MNTVSFTPGVLLKFVTGSAALAVGVSALNLKDWGTAAILIPLGLVVFVWSMLEFDTISENARIMREIVRKPAVYILRLGIGCFMLLMLIAAITMDNIPLALWDTALAAINLWGGIGWLAERGNAPSEPQAPEAAIVAKDGVDTVKLSE